MNGHPPRTRMPKGLTFVALPLRILHPEEVVCRQR